MVVIGLGKNLLFKSVLAHCGGLVDAKAKIRASDKDLPVTPILTGVY